ncbi:kinase-like protein [Peniophora sp. CONT]|nr:kinase-like protein [Peniophora sp. CONT]
MASAEPVWPRYVGNYLLGRKLGSGVSGSTFQATHVHTGMVVALKLQPLSISYATNDYERVVYPLIQGGEGMPTLWAHGRIGQWDYLAMDLLGASLQGLLREADTPTMDMRSVISIAVQLITRLEFMHSRGILHRDVQLGNSVIGLPPNETLLYMIDFGFSEKYVNSKGKHIRNRQQPDFIGNYWFSSVNVHCRGKTTSRRDDLESLALVLIHILTPGGLPWTRNGVPRDDAEHDRLKRCKRDYRPEDLCDGLPEEFAAFLHYCRGLQFSAQPDYPRWRERFLELGKSLGYGDVRPFIWPPPPVKNNPTVQVKRTHTPVPNGDMEQILQGLAQMDLQGSAGRPKESTPAPIPPIPVTAAVPAPAAPPAQAAEAAVPSQPTAGRPILGQKDLNAAPPAASQRPAGRSAAKKAREVIDISSDSSTEVPLPVGRNTKAARLMRLTRQCELAVDNRQLAGLVNEFLAILGTGTSRTLTKEGFSFLDALYKQLADPSIFIVPLRTSQRRSARAPAPARQEVTNEERRSRMSNLRASVAYALSNRQLARLVADFGTLTDKAGKKLTKDSFVFLEGVGSRLTALSGAA